MAAVDSLLRVIASQSAEGMTLVSGQAPRMVKAGFTTPLSMPPVGATLMETFVSEVLAPEQRVEAEREGGVLVEYGEFNATVTRQGDSWTLAFRKRPPSRGSAAASVAAPLPATSAPAAAPAVPPAPLSQAVPAQQPAPAPPRQPQPVPAASPAAAAQLGRWLDEAFEPGVSDVIVTSGRGAWLRTAGRLVALPGAPLAAEQLVAVLAPALDPGHHEALARHGSTDFSWVVETDGARRRFRVNLFRHTGGLSAALRPIRANPPTLEALDLPGSLTRLVGFPNGLVLVSGPTGSGKSTTLVALIEHLNRTERCHVVTIEDPIEYEYRPGQALIHQRELGAHLDSFEAGLRAALREAPDVILVGEMRDRATISAALTAAETGHLVLSTLHAAHAGMAVERIVDVFPEHQQRQVRGQLAGSLRAVLTQHLLRGTAAGALVPVFELLISTPATAALIRDGKTHQLPSAIQTGRDEGMLPLDRSLADRIEARKISMETAMTVTQDGGAQLRELLGRRRGESGTAR